MNASVPRGSVSPDRGDPGLARAASIAAHVAPLGLFLVFTEFEQSAGWPYYPWLYGAKIAAVSAVLWFVRDALPRWSRRGVALGALAGIAGVVVWIATARFTQRAIFGSLLPASLLAGGRAAFDPATIAAPAGYWAFLVARLFGLAVFVPLAEEQFWRGFLSRYLISARFDLVDYGTFTRWSFAIVALTFGLVHPELVAALIWGAGANLLLMRTRNLWSCIVMHATTNGLLGAYVLAFGRWELW